MRDKFLKLLLVVSMISTVLINTMQEKIEGKIELENKSFCYWQGPRNLCEYMQKELEYVDKKGFLTEAKRFAIPVGEEKEVGVLVSKNMLLVDEDIREGYVVVKDSLGNTKFDTRKQKGENHLLPLTREIPLQAGDSFILSSCFESVDNSSKVEVKYDKKIIIEPLRESSLVEFDCNEKRISEKKSGQEKEDGGCSGITVLLSDWKDSPLVEVATCNYKNLNENGRKGASKIRLREPREELVLLNSFFQLAKEKNAEKREALKEEFLKGLDFHEYIKFLCSLHLHSPLNKFGIINFKSSIRFLEKRFFDVFKKTADTDNPYQCY